MILNVFFLCFLSFISHMLTGAGNKALSINVTNSFIAMFISIFRIYHRLSDLNE